MNPTLIIFILEQAEQQPVDRRIQIYTDLLSFLPANSSMKKYREEIALLLDSLELIQQNTRQLLFNLQSSICNP